jgi:hypothetical protein
MTKTDAAKPLIGLDPSSGLLTPSPGKDRPQPRPASLRGAVVGLVANGLGRAEPFLHRLYDELSRDGTAGAVPVLKTSVSSPPEPQDWARLTSEATVAVTGVGG